jgi:hypothetical protein
MTNTFRIFSPDSPIKSLTSPPANYYLAVNVNNQEHLCSSHTSDVSTTDPNVVRHVVSYAGSSDVKTDLYIEVLSSSDALLPAPRPAIRPGVYHIEITPQIGCNRYFTKHRDFSRVMILRIPNSSNVFDPEKPFDSSDITMVACDKMFSLDLILFYRYFVTASYTDEPFNYGLSDLYARFIILNLHNAHYSSDTFVKSELKEQCYREAVKIFDTMCHNVRYLTAWIVDEIEMIDRNRTDERIRSTPGTYSVFHHFLLHVFRTNREYRFSFDGWWHRYHNDTVDFLVNNRIIEESKIVEVVTGDAMLEHCGHNSHLDRRWKNLIVRLATSGKIRSVLFAKMIQNMLTRHVETSAVRDRAFPRYMPPQELIDYLQQVMVHGSSEERKLYIKCMEMISEQNIDIIVKPVYYVPGTETQDQITFPLKQSIVNLLHCHQEKNLTGLQV